MHTAYSIASPSLEGLLTHDAIMYEGLRRPVEALRAMDGPGARKGDRRTRESKLLEQYFYDLYGVFMKKLSGFVLEAGPADAEAVKLQALLQEMIKVKRLMVR